MASQDYRIPANVYNQFSKVDNFINENLLVQDSGLDATLKANASADLDEIDVAPNQGKLLYLLAKLNNSKNILEVGTLGGYSAIWFAKAVGADGKVTTLEIDPNSAKVARNNVESAGYGDIVDVKVGAAAHTLRSFSDQVQKPVYDFVFIDADKENNLNYFQYALEFSKTGTVIVVDNIARRGRLADETSEEVGVIGTRKLFQWLKTEDDAGRGRVESTAIQTVGSKGWDGFLIATVIA